MTRLDIPKTTTLILTREFGETTAYCIDSGDSSPGILFLPGFRSDMQGNKAQALSAHCRQRGQACTRFDYFGHGASSGDFRAGTIGRWQEDALVVLDRLTQGPQILVGSSMGCWIALLVALARPDRVAGLVGIAGAPDFTEDLVWARLDEGQRRGLKEEGEVTYDSAYEGDPVPFTRTLIEEGRNHLLLRAPIALSCPVRLLHGMADPDVPYQTSFRLAKRLTGAEVTVELIADGDHRLSRESDLARILSAVDELSVKARR
ncbi:MAG TPA: alpha/beta hydrolase [Dongiaceae bacterium]|nr:alpha/beta hydrolase [Dongiaceae bacterium]